MNEFIKKYPKFEDRIEMFVNLNKKYSDRIPIIIFNKINNDNKFIKLLVKPDFTIYISNTP